MGHDLNGYDDSLFSIRSVTKLTKSMSLFCLALVKSNQIKSK